MSMAVKQIEQSEQKAINRTIGVLLMNRIKERVVLGGQEVVFFRDVEWNKQFVCFINLLV